MFCANFGTFIIALTPPSQPIQPPNICNCVFPTGNTFCPLVQCQLLVRWWEDAQTKRKRHHPWCGDDAYALGWGVLASQAMVGAVAARPHG